MEKFTLLIVDDNELNCYTLKLLLEDTELEDLEILTVLSAKEAFSILINDSYNINLILSDIQMPEIDGFDFVKELKHTEKTSSIPVIFLSAKYTKDEEIEEAFKVGVTDFITKPINENILVSKLKSYINAFHMNLNYEILNKKLEETLKEREKQEEIISNSIIYSETDLEGKITKVSNAFCDLSGYSKNELLGSSHNIVRHPDMKAEIFEHMWKTIQSGKTWNGEIKNKNKNGDYYWVDSMMLPIFDTNNIIIGYTSVRQDITDKKMIEYLSISDEMTTLYNKRYFNQIFEKEISRRKRDEEYFGFFIFDVDNFKQYNDNYGHQKGDEVLASIGKTVKKHCKRSSDTPFRIGGEEFAVIFHPKLEKNAIEFVEIIRKEIEALKIEHKYNSASNYVTVSIGLYTASNQNIKSAKEIFKLTDDALYKAKDEGRNKICLVD